MIDAWKMINDTSDTSASYPLFPEIFQSSAVVVDYTIEWFYKNIFKQWIANRLSHEDLQNSGRPVFFIELSTFGNNAMLRFHGQTDRHDCVVPWLDTHLRDEGQSLGRTHNTMTAKSLQNTDFLDSEQYSLTNTTQNENDQFDEQDAIVVETPVYLSQPRKPSFPIKLRITSRTKSVGKLTLTDDEWRAFGEED